MPIASHDLYHASVRPTYTPHFPSAAQVSVVTTLKGFPVVREGALSLSAPQKHTSRCAAFAPRAHTPLPLYGGGRVPRVFAQLPPPARPLGAAPNAGRVEHKATAAVGPQPRPRTCGPAPQPPTRRTDGRTDGRGAERAGGVRGAIRHDRHLHPRRRRRLPGSPAGTPGAGTLLAAAAPRCQGPAGPGALSGSRRWQVLRCLV
ncbi:uncharacterized protein LJ264_002868 isoform 1-T1 [Porphyrio hochstetteri]